MRQNGDKARRESVRLYGEVKLCTKDTLYENADAAKGRKTSSLKKINFPPNHADIDKIDFMYTSRCHAKISRPDFKTKTNTIYIRHIFHVYREFFL